MTAEVSVSTRPRLSALDGRHLRSERTRQTMIEAYLKLVRQNGRVPTGAEVARQAGYALRSVFERFTSMDELNLAALDHAMAQSRGDMVVTEVEADRPARLRQHVDARARVCEEWLPLWRVSTILMRGAHRPLLASRLEKAHQEDAVWLDQFYRAELQPMPADRRARACAILATLTSFESWDLLRHAVGLSLQESKQAWCETIDRLLV